MAISEVYSNIAATTSSTTDVTITSMTLTPGAGDYIVLYWMTHWSDTDDSTFTSLYLNTTQQGHSEREWFQEPSIRGTNIAQVSHAYISGVGASDTITAKWRMSPAGTVEANQRMLVAFPVDSADIDQSTATVDATTTSTTDVVITGMTVSSPGAGDYLVLFSASAEGGSGDEIAFTVYVGGSPVAHTERTLGPVNSSIPNTESSVFIAAHVSPTAGQDVDIRWRRAAGSGTLTIHQRTLTLYAVDSADIEEVSAEATTTSTSTTDELLNSMTLTTPANDDWLALFSHSYHYGTLSVHPKMHPSIYVGGSQVADTEGYNQHENSIDDMYYCMWAAGPIAPNGSQDVQVYWRSDQTDTRTSRDRTLVIVREPTAAAGRTTKNTDPFPLGIHAGISRGLASKAA